MVQEHYCRLPIVFEIGQNVRQFDGLVEFPHLGSDLDFSDHGIVWLLNCVAFGILLYPITPR